MNDERTSKPATQQPKTSLREILRESNAEALTVIQDAKSVDTPRVRFLTVLLFGVCVASLLSTMGAPRLDTALQVAVIAFVLAAALLVLDLGFAAVKFRTSKVKRVNLMGEGIQVAAWIIGDGVGGMAVFVGMSAVVWHLSESAFWIGLVALVGGFVLIAIGAFVYTLFGAWREYQKHQALERAAGASVSTDTETAE